MTDPTTRLNAALEGRYRVERQLGEGGMATVYLARDEKHNRNVALKVLKPELAAIVGAERFLAEIKTTANLQHPHILPLFDSGEADTFLFYVMPYVEGETLRERIDRERQLAVGEAVGIATKVAGALQAAHERGVIHRDIKPANILLSKGEPLVSDFGIALAVTQGGAGRLTETGLSLGTPHYMSPEQATGDMNVGAATDIYALGCVLYEMLVGEPPYTGSTPQAILGKIIQAEAMSATKARRSVPANVDSAIRMALEKIPADRFATAAAFAAALTDPGFRHAVAMGVLSQQRRPRWLTPALVAISILAGAAASTLWTGGGRPAPSVPSTRVRITPPDGIRSGEVSPDGRYIVSVGANPAQLWLWRLNSLEATPLAGTDGAIQAWWSPDSRSVAFRTSDALRRIDIAGGPPQTLAQLDRDREMGASGAWGGNGVILFPSGNGLYRVPAGGGEATPAVTRSSGHLDLPVFLPNGIDFLYLDHNGPEAMRGVYVGSLDRAPEEQAQAPLVAAQDGPLLVLGDRRDEAYLLYSRDGTLMSQPFDLGALALRGDAGPLASGLAGGEGNGLFSASSRGEVLIYVEGVEGLRGTLFDLVLVDRQGVAQSLNLGVDAYWYPRFSPDGTRLAVSVESPSDEDLWVFDLDRGSRSRVTFGGMNRFFPVWTPSGDRLTYGARNSTTSLGSNTIRSAPAEGGGATETLLQRDGEQNPTSWSPDGSALVYHEVSSEGQRDVWLLRPNGEPEPLVVTPFDEQGAIFSPDGRWLAYVSNESGQHEVYVRPFPGPGPRHTVSTHGGVEPAWSRDGSELFYRTGDQFMVVDVELGGAFRAGAPQPLFVDRYANSSAMGQRNARVAQYDVAPDGQHFVMLRAATETASVILLQNVLEELRERVPD